MKKNILPFVAIAILIFFVACSTEDILPETKLETKSEVKPEIARTISLTIFTPDNPNTRVALEQKEDNTISLTWETGDELQLAFVKEGKATVNKTVAVTNISTDKKKAQFDIVLPVGFEEGQFDLYGVYGGGVLSGTNATLPANADSATSLEDVQIRKDVMLHFASKGIDATNSQVSVTFQHLGSLFAIHVKNSGSLIEDIKEARLVGVGGTGNWAYNYGDGGKIYDLVTGKFQDTESGGNYISFTAPKNSLSNGETITFWGWYPPLPDKNWPELKLELRDANTALYTSVNSKPARDAPTAAGKSYYFYAEWDGLELSFTDKFVPLATDLFFSEYVEGSAYNKYLEIFNGTGTTVDLSDYEVHLYSNGAIKPGNKDVFSRFLENGKVLVLRNSRATIYGGDAIVSSTVNFNGDDAVALIKISTGEYVDIIGSIGHDPGDKGWIDAHDKNLTTLDRTLVRKSSVRGGVTVNPIGGFPTLSNEWISYPINTGDYLGSHTMN